MLKIGLWLYDLLAGVHNIARHQWFSPPETLRMAPTLRPEGLLGCGLYYDAQVNDARLVLENILAAEQAGAQCLNYHQALSASGINDGFTEIRFQDLQSGKENSLSARCVVNASGPWANQTAKMFQTDSAPLVRPTRGTHLVVRQVLGEKAVLITTRKDKRVIFVIPWRGYSLVGTTDLDDPQDPDQTKPSEAEIDYLLTEASRLFPGQNWDRSKVLAAFSGLRPLAWAEADQASSISREDKILRQQNRITIVGGKLTTYRAMAEKSLRAAASILGKPARRLPFNLPGTPSLPWKDFLEGPASQWPHQYGVSAEQAAHLAFLYGQRGEMVLELTREEPGLLEKLHPARPEILAQVVYAITREKAVHLSDVLLRRLEIGYTPYRWGEACEKTAGRMARLLGWDEPTRTRELSEYKRHLLPSVE
jgi:glycerol-3-phosphate dehydrogenase